MPFVFNCRTLNVIVRNARKLKFKTRKLWVIRRIQFSAKSMGKSVSAVSTIISTIASVVASATITVTITIPARIVPLLVRLLIFQLFLLIDWPATAMVSAIISVPVSTVSAVPAVPPSLLVGFLVNLMVVLLICGSLINRSAAAPVPSAIAMPISISTISTISTVWIIAPILLRNILVFKRGDLLGIGNRDRFFGHSSSHCHQTHEHQLIKWKRNIWNNKEVWQEKQRDNKNVEYLLQFSSLLFRLLCACWVSWGTDNQRRIQQFFYTYFLTRASCYTNFYLMVELENMDWALKNLLTHWEKMKHE